MITRAFLIENGITGLLAGLVVGGLGTIAAFFLVTRLKIDRVFLPGPLLWTVGLAASRTAALGFAGTWRALGAKPAFYLRND
jgi:putative ABC transport system permease protein